MFIANHTQSTLNTHSIPLTMSTNLDLELAKAELLVAQLRVQKKKREESEEGYSTKGPRRCKFGSNCNRKDSCTFVHPKQRINTWTTFHLRKNLHGFLLKQFDPENRVCKMHEIDGHPVLGVTELGHFLATEDGKALKANLKLFQSEKGFKQTKAIQKLLETSHTLEVVDITESLGTATTQYGIRLKEDSKVSADEAASGDDASADEAASE